MNRLSLRINAEIYDAEAIAICRRAISSLIPRVASRIHICLDNLSVIQDVGNIIKWSSQAAFQEFKDAAPNWL